MPAIDDKHWVYILANKRNGTLYVGSTNDLARRVAQHKRGDVPGFTKRYGVDRLVHAESFADLDNALIRERRLKKWQRKWKIELIEKENPQWLDLSERLNR